MGLEGRTAVPPEDVVGRGHKDALGAGHMGVLRVNTHGAAHSGLPDRLCVRE